MDTVKKATSTSCDHSCKWFFKWYCQLMVGFACVVVVTGCSPTVKVEAPDKPIEITMNVNINHQILVKVEKDIDEMVKDNPNLF